MEKGKSRWERTTENSCKPGSTIHLALSGGGIRSFAQLALLEHLEENHVATKTVAGTSMGAVIAFLHACGFDSKKVREIAIHAQEEMVRRGLFSNPLLHIFHRKGDLMNGIIDIGLIIDFYREVLVANGIRSFADLAMPVAIPSVDVKTGRAVVFTNDASAFDLPPQAVFYDGDAEPAIALAASSAVPFAISSVTLGDHLLVDGGCLHNIPTEYLPEDGNPRMAAALFRPYSSRLEGEGITKIPSITLDIVLRQLEHYQGEYADILVQLPADSQVFEWTKGKELYEAAREYLREHPVVRD